jgi:glucosamine-6-phosphate deaminase
MRVRIEPDRRAMSTAAANHAARSIRDAISRRGKARIVAATGASQLDFLGALTALPDLDWARVELFHLDEYVGLPESHPASFRRYLRENLIDPAGIATYHFLNAEANADEVRARVGAALDREDVDVMFAGIGENGHLAFNDPPADFVTTEPYIVVTLDDACRRQQVGEGWFARFEDVPATAISMSIRQMLKAREMIVVVPDERKAAAVKATLQGPISPAVPASILRTHPNATLYLDEPAASQLDPSARKKLVAES